ncbi:hypothetical protein NEHOM01_1711 [Nematocida homosporus]|uniref:uncharacterized protein n=1 Tax=Nematocida homosporus TaxID=1912981 RepID=UPI00221FC39A|nr:uncharacterized protein NEHOM01_1711 [Nematocida homosporus]KAI5186791.1 hypothetical protein NEHOM01_1711 [Nematocida homosporus]
MEARHRKAIIVETEKRVVEEKDQTEESSPQDSESSWVNTQESILGDKPYILPNGEVYKKRVRTVMTPTQSESLKKYFKINPFPSADIRGAISASLGMKPRTVQIWFQNQRQKMKHLMQEEEKIKIQRKEPIYQGDKDEETLWVLAHVSCAVFGTADAI